MMATYQQIDTSAMFNTNMALIDLQFPLSSISLANLPLQDPGKCLQLATFLRNRAFRIRKATCVNPLWLHHRFQAWPQSPSSALVLRQQNASCP